MRVLIFKKSIKMVIKLVGTRLKQTYNQTELIVKNSVKEEILNLKVSVILDEFIKKYCN